MKKKEEEFEKINLSGKIGNFLYRVIENLFLLVVMIMMGAWIYCALCYFVSVKANAAENKAVEYVKAYDADTITVNIKDCKFDLACKKVAIRVYGVDTPELRTKNACEKKLGLKARDFVRQKLFKAKKVELSNMIRGKYFRYVANVIVDGKDLSKELIAKRYAVPYFGKTKQIVNWCDMGAK